MAFTYAQRKKFFELVKKYENASVLNEEAKDLSNRIAEMAKTTTGLQELAALITEDIEEEFQAYDFRPLIFGEVKTRALNDRVEYRKKGKKFRAYQITKGGYVPKSQVFNETVTAQPAEFAVRPSTNVYALETGRIGSVAEMRQGALEALYTEYANYTYATLDAFIGNNVGADNYAEVTGAVDKTTLDAMLHWAAEKGNPVIVGTHQSLAPILDFAGHTDAMKEEIQRTGSLGIYRGARLVKLEQFTDVDGQPVIANDKIYVMTDRVGHVDDFGGIRSREVLDPEHDEFSVIMRKEFGLTILEDDKNKVGLIKII